MPHTPDDTKGGTTTRAGPLVCATKTQNGTVSADVLGVKWEALVVSTDESDFGDHATAYVGTVTVKTINNDVDEIDDTSEESDRRQK